MIIMNGVLDQLGRWSFRRRWLVSLGWTWTAALAVVAAVVLSGPTVDRFSIPGTESQRAIDLLGERFPQAAVDGAQAQVVFAAAPPGRLTDSDLSQAVRQSIRSLRTAPQVAQVSDPYESGAVSANERIALVEVSFRVPAPELDEGVRQALEAAAAPARAAGLTVQMRGDAVAAPMEPSTELFGVLIAAVVLIMTLGSLVAAGLPLLTALIGLAVALCLLTAVTGWWELNTDTPGIALMIGLAVAIDYSLFIIARYRQERAGGRPAEEAAGRAVSTAGAAVLYAGLTVIVGLGGLCVVGIPILTELGLATASTVAVAVLVALTLLPALLGIAGRRVDGRRWRRASESGTPTVGRRWARLVSRRPIPVLLTAVLGLGILALPALDLQLGFPDDGTAPPDTTQRRAYDLVTEGFGAGFNGSLTLVVDAAPGTAEAATQRVADVVDDLPGVSAVGPTTVNPAGDTGVLTVVPTDGPNSASTRQAVTTIRAHADDLRAETGAIVLVTGQTALDLDTSDKLEQAMPPYLAVVVGLAIVVLTLAFRSLLVPLTAAAGFLLSFAASFGAVVAVFQWGWLDALPGFEPTGVIVHLLPVMTIGLTFGLAMDYQVFLVSRMREEYLRSGAPSEAVVVGFANGARVVTAAAVIMISVFGGFVLSHVPMLKSFGFALAVAVLFDAFVVRMTIVPAVMRLLGRSAWWLPHWLDRLLPTVTIEGEPQEARADQAVAVGS
jgi:RND superfamily putative drug exporter